MTLRGAKCDGFVLSSVKCLIDDTSKIFKMDVIREKVIRMEGAKYCHVIPKNSDVKTVYE